MNWFPFWGGHCPHFLCLLLIVVLGVPQTLTDDATESAARLYLKDLEKRYSQACNAQATAGWNFRVNITDETKALQAKGEEDYFKFQAQIQKEILEKFPNWRDIKDEQIKREFRFLVTKGPALMNPENVLNMVKLQGEMETAYHTTTVCSYKDPSDCSVRLDQIIEIMLESKDEKELGHYFHQWHDKISENVPPTKYHKFAQYQTEMAKANGFNDMSDMWMLEYDDYTPDWSTAKFKEQILKIWEEIKPMFEILHAYVRMKLRRIPEYEGVIQKCGYIPCYLTGNMWSQFWTKVNTMTRPFPNAPNIDATAEMKKNNYTPVRMFQEAEKFFVGLGMPPMTQTFWEKSMLERPTDGRQVVCSAMAEDFCWGENNTDFRIMQCTQVNMDQLVIVHHEMGHVVYYQRYVHQDFIFRQGANNGFHEAIGDAIALAVVTPKHLQCVLKFDLGQDPSLCTENPLEDKSEASETDLNFLYMKALTVFPVMSFAISMDSWRWEAFEGKLQPEQYNKRWWEIKMKNQGVTPVKDRSSPYLSDPVAKFHVPANIEYLRYFISHLIEFQFYEAMCIAAGQFDPKIEGSKLYKCDFAFSKEAGKLLGDVMGLGFSKPWPVAFEKITGSSKMSTSSLKNYFQPILKHMKKELDENGEIIGFGESCEEVKARNAGKR